MKNNVLVVVAHADDETLGCGGTIARHVDQGDRVCVVTMTDGVSARVDTGEAESIERENAFSQAMKVLDVESKRQFSFPDNRMDQVALLDVVVALETVANEFSPNIVYTHFSGDLNVDHRVTYQAVMTAFRPLPNSCISKILTFEVLSSTEWSGRSFQSFQPNCFVDIHLYWKQKLQALEKYKAEMRDFPHSRSYESLEALALLRGANNGLAMAEAFEIERLILR